METQHRMSEIVDRQITMSSNIVST